MKQIEYLSNYGLFKDFDELGFNIGHLRKLVGKLPDNDGVIREMHSTSSTILRHIILNNLFDELRTSTRELP